MNEQNFYAYGYQDVFLIEDPSREAIMQYIKHYEESDIIKKTEIYHSIKHLSKYIPEDSSNPATPIEIYQAPAANLIQPVQPPGIKPYIIEDTFSKVIYSSGGYSLRKLYELQPIEYRVLFALDFSKIGKSFYLNEQVNLSWYHMTFCPEMTHREGQKWTINYALFSTDFVSVSDNAQKEFHFKNEKTKSLNTIKGDLSFYVPHATLDQPVPVKDIIAGFYAASRQAIIDKPQENEGQKYFFKNAFPSCFTHKKFIMEQHHSIQTFTSKQEVLKEIKWFSKEMRRIVGETNFADHFFYEIKEIKLIDVYDSNLIPNEKGELVQRYPNAGYVKRDARGTLIYPGTSSFYEKQHLSDGTLLNEVMTEKMITRERYFPRQVFTLHVKVTLVNPTSKKEVTLNMGIPGALFSITQ